MQLTLPTNVDAPSGRRWIFGATAVLPLALFLWLSLGSLRDHRAILPTQHFFVVTNVSLLAAGVAFLIARAALRIEQYNVLLIALGFMAMAGLFSVHAIATPGVLMSGGPHAPGQSTPDIYGGEITVPLDYTGVVGLSAFLSLLIPSFLFAAGATPSVVGFVRRFPISSRGAVVVVIATLLTYATLSVQRPDLVAGIPLSRPPYSFLVGAVSIALLGLAAWRQRGLFRRSQLPIQGALVPAYLLLAQAQVIMVVAPFWSLGWWEYHVLMFTGVALAFAALFVELDRRRDLERFLASELVERVVSGGGLRIAGERRTLTVLFADLRGSTVLADRLPAEEVVGTLNAYLSAMAKVVLDRGGMLDKFLGDGLLALFGVMDDATDGAEAAVRAALDMRRAVAQVGVDRERGVRAMGLGVGIHTGEVVLGAIGLPRRMEFTAVGDTVNTAARLQELCKELGVDVILSGETATRLAGRGISLKDLGAREVRGKREAIRVHTV